MSSHARVRGRWPLALRSRPAASTPCAPERVFPAGDDRISYSLSGSYLRTDGFSRVDENLGATEEDGARTYTLTGKAGAHVTDIYEISFAGSFSGATADTDPSLSSVSGDGDAETKRKVYSGQVNNLIELLDGRFHNRISAFLLQSDRDFFDSRSAAARYTSINGKSYGGEYQGSLDFAKSTTLTVGARAQIDSGEGFATRSNGLRVPQYDAEFETYSAYGQIELATPAQSRHHGGRSSRRLRERRHSRHLSADGLVAVRSNRHPAARQLRHRCQGADDLSNVLLRARPGRRRHPARQSSARSRNR